MRAIFQGFDDYKTTDLSGAIFHSETNDAEALINAGVDLNEIDERGRNALYYAFKMRNAWIAALLLEKNVEIQEVDKKNFLMQAVEMMDLDLIDKLANKGITILQSSMRDSILTIGVQTHDLNTVKGLIQRGANVNGLNSDGLTTLHVSVINADLDICEALLAAGADINALSSEGISVFRSFEENKNAFIDKEKYDKIENWLKNQHAKYIPTRGFFERLRRIF